MAPASTGSDSNRRIIVSMIAHTNNGICSSCIFCGRIFIIVVIKLIALIIEDAPARCREKIAISIDFPLCLIFLASGGYTVHPVPAPFSVSIDIINSISDGINSHRLRLFSRGKAISGDPSISGSSQFPNPPIKIGITKKKIIKNACAVMIVL